MDLILAYKDSYQTFTKIHCSPKVNSESEQAKESNQLHLKAATTTMMMKTKEEEEEEEEEE
jgi:hypothetical protein